MVVVSVLTISLFSHLGSTVARLQPEVTFHNPLSRPRFGLIPASTRPISTIKVPIRENEAHSPTLSCKVDAKASIGGAPHNKNKTIVVTCLSSPYPSNPPPIPIYFTTHRLRKSLQAFFSRHTSQKQPPGPSSSSTRFSFIHPRPHHHHYYQRYHSCRHRRPRRPTPSCLTRTFGHCIIHRSSAEQKEALAPALFLRWSGIELPVVSGATLPCPSATTLKL